MRKIRGAILAGAAALALAGAAMAASDDTRYLELALPDGSVARIEYQGDAVPEVALAPASALAEPIALLDPLDTASLIIVEMIPEVSALAPQLPAAADIPTANFDAPAEAPAATTTMT